MKKTFIATLFVLLCLCFRTYAQQIGPNGTSAPNVSNATGTLSTSHGGTGQTTGATSFCMGSSATIAASTTGFVTCGGTVGVTAISVEASEQQLIPAACTISNLSVKIATAANANVPVITVDDNAVGQAVTCTYLNGGTTCTDVTHSFTTAAGDLLSIKLVNPAGANATGIVNIGLQINC